MTYLVVLSNRDDFIQSLNTLFASKEVVVSQAKNLTELVKIYNSQVVHLVIYDELTKLNLDYLNEDKESPGLDVLPFIVIHHQILITDYYYQLGVLNVIGVEQYEGILPKLIATCMLHMDVKLRARMFDMKEQSQSAKGNNVEERIDQIPKIIKEFIFKEPITIEFLANQLKISRRHLLRKIYDRYDMTAINLITNVKMGICHEMLQSNQYSIDEVCSLLGFKSPYYFKKKYENYLKTIADNPITNRTLYM
jgi:AraC-like DNA-binding protein